MTYSLCTTSLFCVRFYFDKHLNCINIGSYVLRTVTYVNLYIHDVKYATLFYFFFFSFLETVAVNSVLQLSSFQIFGTWLMKTAIIL